MKRAILLFVITTLVSITANSQKLDSFDQISPFHEGLAAVQVDDKWGFIDANGDLIVNFRGDLVADQICEMECCNANTGEAFPMFHNGRALIQESKDGIIHYGYIDKNGKTVIATDYLKATPFSKNGAIVIHIYKEVMGENQVLGKKMISYSYNQEIIDVNGKTIFHLNGPVHMTYSKERVGDLKELPVKFLSKTLVAVKVDQKWELRSALNQ